MTPGLNEFDALLGAFGVYNEQFDRCDDRDRFMTEADQVLKKLSLDKLHECRIVAELVSSLIGLEQSRRELVADVCEGANRAARKARKGVRDDD